MPEILSYGKNLEKTPQFRKLIESLLLRAKGDSVDSVRVQAQASLQDIISASLDSVLSLIPALSPL